MRVSTHLLTLLTLLTFTPCSFTSLLTYPAGYYILPLAGWTAGPFHESQGWSADLPGRDDQLNHSACRRPWLPHAPAADRDRRSTPPARADRQEPLPMFTYLLTYLLTFGRRFVPWPPPVPISPPPTRRAASTARLTRLPLSSDLLRVAA